MRKYRVKFTLDGFCVFLKIFVLLGCQNASCSQSVSDEQRMAIEGLNERNLQLSRQLSEDRLRYIYFSIEP